MFIPLRKVDAKERLVYGRIDETPDRAGEVFDYASSKPFFKSWSDAVAKATDGKSLGNVRAMHGNVAAGKLETIEYDDAHKAVEIAARIVDDAEWAKVEAGVYTGFSPGGRYLKRWKDGDVTRYTAGPSEISIVDLPCIPSATFTLVKADGLSVEVPLTGTAVTVEDLRKFLGEQAWDSAAAIEALNTLYSLLGAETAEPENQPDQIAAIQDAIQRIKDFIASEIQEPDPGTMEQAAATGDLAKAGARNSKADSGHIQAIHDHAAALGATCAGAEKMAGGDLAKMAGDLAAATQTLTKITGERDALQKRVAELEAEPAGGGPRLKALEKAADYTPAPGAGGAAPAEGDDFQAALAKINAMPIGAERAAALRKLAASHLSEITR